MRIDITDEKQSAAKVIWQLAWPTVLEQLLIMMVNYVDTAMVGTGGANSTAAIAVVNSTLMLINGICAALGVGFSVMLGKSIGARDIERARSIMRQAVTITAIVGVGMTVIGQSIAHALPVWMGAEPDIMADAEAYFRIVSAAFIFNASITVAGGLLRASGDTRTPLAFNVASNLINAALNFLLIFPTRLVEIFGWRFTMPGAGMGVSGAALATAISMAFGGIMLMRALFSHRRDPHISIGEDFRLKKATVREMVRLAVPTALERLTMSGGHITVTAIVTSLGTLSLAANHLAVTAESVTYMPAFGLSIAATTLVSQSIGAKKPELATRYARLCIIAGVILMSCLGVVLFIFAEQLVGIFTPDTAVAELGGRVLRIEALAQPFFAMGMVGMGCLRGAGDTKWPFYISVIGMWCVRIVMALLLVNLTDIGLMGAWIAMASDLTVRGFVTLFRLRRGKWKEAAA